MKVKEFLTVFNLFSLGYIEIIIQHFDVAHNKILQTESYYIGYFDNDSYKILYNKWGEYQVIEAYLHKMIRNTSLFYIDVEEEDN